MTLRLALLAGLGAPVGPDSRDAAGALAFELAEGLLEVSRDTGELSADLFARRGSWRGLPLVALDPGEVAAVPAHRLDRFATPEALYVQLVLSGMLEGYDLVHCLAPVVTPLQLLAAAGLPIVQTLAVSPTHPAARLPPRLIAPHLLRQVHLLPVAGMHRIAPGVDTQRFRPDPEPTADYLLWLGASRQREAAAVAASLGLPLRGWGRGGSLAAIQNACAILHLDRAPSPAGLLWPLRALACGTPVAGWRGSALEELADGPACAALATPGDVAGLAAAIRALPDRNSAAPLRRQHVLGHYGRRAMIGRYRELYRALTKIPPS